MAPPSLTLASAQPDPGLTVRPGDPKAGRLGALLVGAGRLDPADLAWALGRQGTTAAPLGQILMAAGAITAADLNAVLARQYGTVALDPARFACDTTLLDRLGAPFCLRHDVLPLCRMGSATLVVTARPELFGRLRPAVEAQLGKVLVAMAERGQIRSVVLRLRGRELVGRAETMVDAPMSCRSLSRLRLTAGALAAVAAALLAMTRAPVAAFTLCTAAALLILTANTALGLIAAALALRRSPPVRQASDVTMLPDRGVCVSLLVPLFREGQMVAHLVERLRRLDYPPELLDIHLIVEEDDTATRAALARTPLPSWMHGVVVPRGSVRTKPRALNFALELCRGDIIGVYDAEDAPAPDQIARAVAQFQLSPPQVACLQGRLDFYNTEVNWITRCFTLDYAVWFRLILPALARLGLVIPLGGTTLFFRRAALNRLGGWDSHNVTEDADLGLRLARQGYRTELLDSTTFEEATCRIWPWIRQRSRWQKGYALTWLVHMRDPAALWRDLGPRRFLGVQLLFCGSLGAAALAPFLWSFLLLGFGLDHPWRPWIGFWGTLAITLTMAAALLVQFALALIAVRLRGANLLGRATPWLVPYHLLASLSIVKAGVEMVVCPFFWDKTRHGLFRPPPCPNPPPTPPPPP
ncbi:glycosyltransferase family 2 protein [Oceaniglobus roseus]|uniref:glycosyltransferase family 2 protein n=1 Tax=Oceaniglobus roseus TaxID=1737570 RepID=UPI000C7F1C7B|nr:glycosyltransferase [Kandeliimicrobium roseum]